MDKDGFDFRNLYKKGDIIYWVHIIDNPYVGHLEKELKVLKIQSVYPRIIFAFLPKSICYSLGYKDREYIYTDRTEAQKAFNKLKIRKYEENDNSNNSDADDN